MDLTILQGLENIRNGFFDFLFAFFTFFGEETFIVIAVAAVYWIIDKKTGEFLIYTALFSAGVNGFIKNLIKRPRPFETGKVTKADIDNFLVSTNLEGTYSFPSGHSQNSAALFAGLSINTKKKRVYLISALAVFLVMLSRLYLGVHYPSDVLSGAAIGIAAALLCHFIFVRFYDKRGYIFLCLALLLCLSMFFSDSHDAFTASGAFLGAAAGLLIEQKFINFQRTTVPKGILRLVLGVAVILGVRLGFKAVFPNMPVFHFLRYFLMIFTMTGLYPMLFKKLKF